MKANYKKLAIAAALSLTMMPVFADSGVVTIYSADGLHDGAKSWYGDEFAAFTKATGIKVQYIEAGSGGVVERIAKEKSNTQAASWSPCRRSCNVRQQTACCRNSRRPTRRISKDA